MIGVIGDLLEDVVVTIRAATPTRPVSEVPWLVVGADTPARIARRSGGSAATVATTALRLGIPTRFIGHVGDDATGRALVAGLEREGVETRVRHGGSTGVVVVLLHPDGERTMLTDRGSAPDLADPEPGWIDGLSALHIPLYAMERDPLASSAASLAAWAHRREIPVFVDLSSVTLLRQLGSGLAGALDRLAPTVAIANDHEARTAEDLGLDLADLADLATVVKRGGAPAQLIDADGRRSVPAVRLGSVPDTTGAGDAFAAGLVAALTAGSTVEDAVMVGHRSAARHLTERGAAPPS